MKVKRYKHAKKVLSFYKNAFKIREPYQIIGELLNYLFPVRHNSLCPVVDGTFCQAALKGKIQIKEQFPKYLGGRIQLGRPRDLTFTPLIVLCLLCTCFT